MHSLTRLHSGPSIYSLTGSRRPKLEYLSTQLSGAFFPRLCLSLRYFNYFDIVIIFFPSGVPSISHPSQTFPSQLLSLCYILSSFSLFWLISALLDYSIHIQTIPWILSLIVVSISQWHSHLLQTFPAQHDIALIHWYTPQKNLITFKL